MFARWLQLAFSVASLDGRRFVHSGICRRTDQEVLMEARVWLQVHVEGRGTVRLDQVKVGDVVQGADASGARKGSRVYFIHDHKEQAPVVQLKHAHGAKCCTEVFQNFDECATLDGDQ